MNQPWVYMCPPCWTPSPLPPHPILQSCLSALALSALFHASNLDWWSITYGNIHVSMLFSQIIPPSPSPTWTYWRHSSETQEITFAWLHVVRIVVMVWKFFALNQFPSTTNCSVAPLEWWNFFINGILNIECLSNINYLKADMMISDQQLWGRALSKFIAEF